MKGYLKIFNFICAVTIASVTLTAYSCKSRDAGDNRSKVKGIAQDSSGAQKLQQLLGKPLTDGVHFEIDQYYTELLNNDSSREFGYMIDELRDVLRVMKTRYGRCFAMNPKEKFGIVLNSKNYIRFNLGGSRDGYFAWLDFSPVDFKNINDRSFLMDNMAAKVNFLGTLGYCSSQLKSDDLSEEWLVSKPVPVQKVYINVKSESTVYGDDDGAHILDSARTRTFSSTYQNLEVVIDNKPFKNLANRGRFDVKTALDLAKEKDRRVQVIIWSPNDLYKWKYPIIRICDAVNNGNPEDQPCYPVKP